jgi:hypothetical protein
MHLFCKSASSGNHLNYVGIKIFHHSFAERVGGRKGKIIKSTQFVAIFWLKKEFNLSLSRGKMLLNLNSTE